MADTPFPDPIFQPTRGRYVDPLVLIRFPEALQMEKGTDPRYVLERDYRVVISAEGQTWEITAPAGMKTDLASVPALFRVFVGRVGRHLEAAVVHDYLYATLNQQPAGAALEARRRFADEVMLVLMQAAKVPLAWPIFLAVRLFGGRSVRRRVPVADIPKDRMPKL